MVDFLRYYERELTFAREMAAGFARKNPKAAARLLPQPNKGEDPHMERLIEAFAFECARLHMKIDDRFPEMVEPLLNMVFPHFIRPIPSMSVVTFEPDGSSIPPSGYVIEKNRNLLAKTSDGKCCKYSTVFPVTIWPVEILAAELRQPRKPLKDAGQDIVIRLKTTNGTGIDRIEWETLHFCINGPAALAAHIYELLFNNACSMEFVAVNGRGKTSSLALSADHIRPAGFEPDGALIPSLRDEFPGYLLLFEYFCFPERFLFFDVSGLDAFKPAGADSFEIRINLDREARRDLKIDKHTFSICSTPVVNLYNQVFPAIEINAGVTEYAVRPVENADDSEIYNIRKVTGTKPGAADIAFKPLHSFKHRSLEENNPEKVFWQAQRRPSTRKNDKGTDVFLSFSDPQMKPACPDAESLVIHAECTSRDLPARVLLGHPAGDLTIDGSAPVNRICFTVKPVPTRRPVLGGALQWQALSSLKPGYLPLMHGQEGAFKAILGLYDFDGCPATGTMIDGIRAIGSQPVTRKVGQAFLRGVEITIGFDQKQYEETGLFLFTSVLDRFLSQFVSSNSFTQLVARTMPGGKLFRAWPPRRGIRPLV